MKVIIVSDFHLKYDEDLEAKERKERIISFLSKLNRKVDILILNGDIFDLWYSWEKVIIKDYFSILKVLVNLIENGTKIKLVSGNHDFWFNGFLEKDLGIEIYNENLIENYNGLKTFVSHGDLFTTNDNRYKIFRFLIRKSFMKFLFKLIHPDLSLSIGKFLSRSSRNRRTIKRIKYKKESGLIQSAKRLLRDYDLVVMGHTHEPKKVILENGLYINSGDWIDHNSYVLINNGKADLFEYNGEEI